MPSIFLKLPLHMCVFDLGMKSNDVMPKGEANRRKVTSGSPRQIVRAVSLEKTRVPLENEWNECEEVCSVSQGSDRWLDGPVQTPKQTLSWLPSTDRVITIIPATAQANIDCHQTPLALHVFCCATGTHRTYDHRYNAVATHSVRFVDRL